MNIAYTSSDGYSQYVGISMMSLFESNKNAENIDIFIIDMKISEENKANLQSIAEKYHRNITFVDGVERVNSFVQKYSLEGFHGGINSYCKIFPDAFLPSLDRVLFVDADTLVVGDIEPLYSMEMGQAIVAAVPDVGVYFFGHEDKEIANKNSVYFNTGILLYNMVMVEQVQLQKRIITAKASYNKPLKLADQSLLNLALNDGEGIRIHFKYNNYVHTVPANLFRDGYTCDKSDQWFLDTVNEIVEARKNPVVIHFVRGCRLGGRPWLKWNTSYYSSAYKHYWRKSPWKYVKRASNIKEMKRIRKILNKNTKVDMPVIGSAVILYEIWLSKYASRKKWDSYCSGRKFTAFCEKILSFPKRVAKKAFHIKQAGCYHQLTVYGKKFKFFSKKFALGELNRSNLIVKKLKDQNNASNQTIGELRKQNLVNEQKIADYEQQRVLQEQTVLELQQENKQQAQLLSELRQRNAQQDQMLFSLQQQNRQQEQTVSDLRQQNDTLTTELIQKRGILERYTGRFWPVSWLPKWKAYFHQNFSELETKMDCLKSGLDEQSKEMADMFLDRYYRLIPDENISNFYLYDRDKFFADFEVKMKKECSTLEAQVKGKYHVPPECNIEVSVFHYHNGLKLLPRELLAGLQNRDFIDGGALWGDSAIVLSQYQPHKIYSFEPLRENYASLLECIQTNSLGAVVPIEKGLGGVCGTRKIYCNSGLSTANMFNVQYKSNQRNIERKISLTTIDQFCRENDLNVGLIKLDVEGCELETIEGAMATIRSEKPILLISIYHTPDDFFEIKPLIQKLDLGYKFMIRKLDYNGYIAELMLIAYCEQCEE